MALKCTAILGDFFIKSEELVYKKERTYSETGKEENDVEGKYLGLFDDSSLREDWTIDTRSETCGKPYWSFQLLFATVFLILFVWDMNDNL